MSGYDIKKMVDTTLRHFWKESYGRLYPTLKKLEGDGLIKSRLKRGRKKPDRIVYSLTSRGRRALKSWLSEPAELPWVRIEILLKLFFAHNVPLETTIKVLEQQRAELANILAQFEGFYEVVDDRVTDPAQKIPFRLTILHGRMIYEARIRWCEEAIRQLQSNPKR
jgi:DNA-binding PadR family transcriptional regulator